MSFGETHLQSIKWHRQVGDLVKLSIAIVPWQALLATCSINVRTEQGGKMLERLVCHSSTI
jgi:hypothetical protein